MKGLVLVLLLLCLKARSQTGISTIDSFRIYGDIKISIDQIKNNQSKRETIIVFYALPNGNTTEHTMGKKIKKDDDWHFDIQHIKAQTVFIRGQLNKKNVVVVYLENDYKSWPAWKQKHGDFKVLIPHLVDSLINLIHGTQKVAYLNGHSGGGSFIFGFLAGLEKIPSSIKRISFLDSDYGYDSSYYSKLKIWLKSVKGAALNVFAYNDSVALYNGKPVVSTTGGTWYRSRLLLGHLMNDFKFSRSTTDSLIIFKSKDKRIQFFLKTNLDGGIYHTQQVAYNGFIHSILCGTKKESKKYNYYSKRVYDNFIE